MPGGVGAILMMRKVDAQTAANQYRWLAGEMYRIAEPDEEFAWGVIPKKLLGSFSVAEVNARSAIEVFSTIEMLDAGTISHGGVDVDVDAGDFVILQPTNYFVNYGPVPASVPTETPTVMVQVEDKTKIEVELYTEAFNKKLDYTSDQYNPVDDMRRFTTSNVRVSASGNNGFTASGIASAISEWNSQDPLSDDPDPPPNPNPIVLVDTDNLTYFQCDGIMPIEVFDEWQEITQKVALGDYYANRRWYITAAGITAIVDAGGFIAGTASQVAPFLRDGLLD